MNFLEQYRQYKSLIEAELESLSYSRQAPIEVYQPLDYMLAIGGKRLRPVMTLAACEAFGGEVQKAIRPALGIEVFHNFTLIHDDIMDNAPIRRGKPTVHQKWNTNVGILSGDMMLIKAYELVCSVDAMQLPQVLRVFNDTATKVCEGQQMDMDFEEKDTVTVADYLKMIEAKTAVLLGGALQVGALIAGADEQDAENMYRFGCKIGSAFQVKDDWLDAFGDEQKVGKRIGGDIAEGKNTFLMIKTRELASAMQRSELYHIYHNGHNDQEKIQAVMNLYHQLKISEITLDEINRLYQEAMEALRTVSIAEDKKQFFKEFAEFLIYRDF